MGSIRSGPSSLGGPDRWIVAVACALLALAAWSVSGAWRARMAKPARPLAAPEVMSTVSDVAPRFEAGSSVISAYGAGVEWEEPRRRWVVVRFDSAEQVEALKRAVVEQVDVLRAGRPDDGKPAATAWDEDRPVAPGSAAAPPWWDADSAPDRDCLEVTYAGTGASDRWVFSQTRKCAYLATTR